MRLQIVGRDLASVIAHDGIAYAQTLTRTGTRRLRRKKRIERAVWVSKAGTVVRDQHPYATLILAGIYAKVLGVDRVGVDESFFDLGGDSLSAMRAIAAINTALDIHLAVPTFFDAPSVTSLSQQLGRRDGR